MTQTYSQIQRTIAKLQKEAEVLRAKELSGVIDRIRVAIAHYGLTAEQLGLAGGRGRGKASVRSKGKASSGVTYSNGTGTVWTGRGPRPLWLREAIAGGASLESFLVAPGAANALTGASAALEKVKGAKAVKRAKQKRRPSTVLYQDGAGNSWTGRGPQPRWLREALAGGKTLEDLKG